MEPHYHLGEEPPPWQVFAADGTWLGPVALPPGLDRGVITYQAPYLRIGSDYVLGIWKDELDAHTVRVYGLEKR